MGSRFAGGEKPAPGIDQSVDGLPEESQRGPAAQAPEARYKFRQSQEIERIDAPDRFEITGYGVLKFARIAAEALRK